ncbi:solute carrier family 12 member 9-like isoform X2 [Lineus longissimus]|uniref:solute carrier family 12 member 9-like isoform X2 n=1 Tax=Lineus longissimus TaxID=88925 RepID=UPI00315D96A7
MSASIIHDKTGVTLAPDDINEIQMASSTSLSSITSTTSGYDEKKPILKNNADGGALRKRAKKDGANGAHTTYHDFNRMSQIFPRNIGDELRRTLGLWGGVFGPVALAQCSNLFLRTGLVVGQSGLLESIAQFILAYFILAMTILSICAISTNGAVEGGGAYYMISRALGPEFGGSIGFLFFLANVLACGLYIAGFVEGVIDNFGPGGNFIGADQPYLPAEGGWYPYLYQTVVLLLCLIVCIIGGSMFARTSLAILLIVVICILSVMVSMFAVGSSCVTIPTSNKVAYAQSGLNETTNLTLCGNYTGLKPQTFAENTFENYTIDYSQGDIQGKPLSFVAVFAILFSSVTGIMNGANMSGELKDPSKSIPVGTMAATAFTFVTYILLTILTAGSSSRYLLINDYGFLQQINLWPPFVVIGMFATTLSAALGNLIGASRVLEALARDELFWILLRPATISTKGGNPYVAVLMTWILVQAVMLIGSLNAIAPLVSVFFLLSYAATNLSCMALDVASAPNFRPTFKYFSWHTCLLGLIGSIVMTFLINPIFASVAIIICLFLIIVLHFRSLNVSWGSISQALIFHQVRKYLLLLDSRKEHVKYWRPQMLLLVSNPLSCGPLITFVNDIKKSGLYILGHVKVGEIDKMGKDPTLEEYPNWLQLIDILKVKAFVELTVSSSVRSGIHHLIRIAGLGGMKPNTVCLGFHDATTPQDVLFKAAPRKKGLFVNVEDPTDILNRDGFSRLRGLEDRKRLSGQEYVQCIQDVLKMQKNCCLFRHFQNFEKKAVVNSKRKMYIDAWPMNFFKPASVTYFDTSCLFLLQIACILHMVPGWKHNTTLRVFLCVDAREDDTLSIENKLDKLLQQLRILAEVKIIRWEHVTCLLDDNSIVESETDFGSNPDFDYLPEDYVQGMNDLIKENSIDTAVTFCYLPAPPLSKNFFDHYLRQLEILTSDLPPTVLVHGLHPVTSTTL